MPEYEEDETLLPNETVDLTKASTEETTPFPHQWRIQELQRFVKRDAPKALKVVVRVKTWWKDEDRKTKTAIFSTVIRL